MQQSEARKALEALQAHPNAWEKVDTILQHSKSQQAKFIALQVILSLPPRPLPPAVCRNGERWAAPHPSPPAGWRRRPRLRRLARPPALDRLRCVVAVDSGGHHQNAMERLAGRPAEGRPLLPVQRHHQRRDRHRLCEQAARILAKAQRRPGPGAPLGAARVCPCRQRPVDVPACPRSAGRAARRSAALWRSACRSPFRVPLSCRLSCAMLALAYLGPQAARGDVARVAVRSSSRSTKTLGPCAARAETAGAARGAGAEEGLAGQVAGVHPGARGRIEDVGEPVRELHAHFEAPLGRGL